MNKTPSKPLTFGMLAALLLALLFFYRLVLRDPSGPPLPVADHDRVKQLALKCEGDFSKLSPQEQAQVNEMENGYGPIAIRNVYARNHR